MKFDLHMHTARSYDSFTKVEDLVKYAKKRQLDGIAITDHGVSATDDMVEIAAAQGIWLIKGNEVYTDIGDILGLFISGPLKSSTAVDVIQEIHGQGGIAILAHPFKYTRNYPDHVLEKLDGVEVVNSRWKDLTTVYQIPKVTHLLEMVQGRSAGSDAHLAFEVGRAYWETAQLDSPEALKQSIVTGQGVASAVCFSTWLDEISQGVKFLKSPSVKQLARIVYWSFRRLIHSGRSGL